MLSCRSKPKRWLSQTTLVLSKIPKIHLRSPEISRKPTIHSALHQSEGWLFPRSLKDKGTHLCTSKSRLLVEETSEHIWNFPLVLVQLAGHCSAFKTPVKKQNKHYLQRTNLWSDTANYSTDFKVDSWTVDRMSGLHRLELSQGSLDEFLFCLKEHLSMPFTTGKETSRVTLNESLSAPFQHIWLLNDGSQNFGKREPVCDRAPPCFRVCQIQALGGCDKNSYKASITKRKVAATDAHRIL